VPAFPVTVGANLACNRRNRCDWHHDFSDLGPGTVPTAAALRGVADQPL
jgi:hypothetical protein